MVWQIISVWSWINPIFAADLKNVLQLWKVLPGSKNHEEGGNILEFCLCGVTCQEAEA
ncbi:hypothetical protein Hdeb2414_s0012g00394801 [Helianthus debilis subsp. tardiflorus]